MYVVYASKLHRPRISDDFLSDTVDWTIVELYTSATCRVLCIAPLHDQLASLDRHAQLPRCFSAVAELLVLNIPQNF